MIKYLTPIAATLLLSSNIAVAKTTSNQAVTVCKAHLKQNVEGFKRAKLGKVRSNRENHTITFAISTEQGRQKTKCSVNKNSGQLLILD